MSAPPGPRGSRTGSRGRGSPRALSRPGDAKNSAGDRQTLWRPPSSTTTGNDSRSSLKPSPKQGQTRHKSGRNPTHSAILDHAGKPPNTHNQRWRDAAVEDSGTYKKHMNDLYQTLKDNRERERKEAIKNGFLANPDKPTSLANAITPVGTCQHMCPEFERVERIVQLMVDGTEKTTALKDPRTKVPCEKLMVKRFRRSAAGYDEQLPSDIRPPAVLQETLNYLFDGVIGGAEPLATVHKFVWDRTRGIRNDFSIQQVTKTEDLRIAIDCFERIARFHILSLHQLSRPDTDNGEFDHHQEREQLNNTLLSLMYYYDDSRHKLVSPNEAEFRAYCIIFEIQDQRPDLEDRAQNWSRSVLMDPRVQIALKLYAAAANTSDEQGPLRPRTQFTTAQANPGGFWNLIKSNAVSYVMSCVAEIYFNLVRSTALEAIWKAYRGKRGGSAKVEDWVLKDLTNALGFDNDDQTWTFCEEHEFQILETEDGKHYLDLGSVTGGYLKDTNPRRKQTFSRNLVEKKRLGRTIPAIISGISASQAKSQGLIEDFSDAENSSEANSESLFLNGNSDEEQRESRSRSSSPQLRDNIKANNTVKLNPTASPFDPKPSFGLPSSKPNPFRITPPLTQTQEKPTSISNEPSTHSSSNPFASKEPPKFNFNAGKPTEALATPTPFSNKGLTTFNSTFSSPTFASATPDDTRKTSTAPAFGASSESKPSVFGQPSKPQKPPTPTFSFGTSPLFASSVTDAKNEESHKDQNVQPNNAQPSQASQAKAPVFSFGTSPLFQPKAEKTEQRPLEFISSQSSPQPSALSFAQPPAKILSTAIPPVLSAPQAQLPDLSSFKNTSPNTAETSKAVSFPASPVPSTTETPTSEQSGFPVAASASTHNQEREPRKSSQPTAATTPVQPKSLPTFAQPLSVPQSDNVKDENPAAFSSSAKPSPSSDSSLFSPTPNEPVPIDTVVASPRPDSRSSALDKLSTSMMLDDGGLLQQFVDYAVGPILASSIHQYEDEKSWEEAIECRVMLLSRKYVKRWKNNAWNLGLIRRGKERRRTFARSMQNLATSSQQKQKSSESSPFSLNPKPTPPISKHPEQTEMMPPPSSRPRKRQSLPAAMSHENSHDPETLRNNKRKRVEPDLNDERETPHRPKHQSHKRSSTVGQSIMSAPPHRFSRTPYRSKIGVSKFEDGSLLGESKMTLARRLAPSTKSDSTRTDYFRLKSLGIDPDTPVVPLTKKRVRTSSDVNGINRTPIHSPASSLSMTATSPSYHPDTHQHQSLVSTPQSQKAKPVDDDEAFFASIRAVRETLADSTSWFQTERESIERSKTPQPSTTPPKNESAAERRLREIRERGHTPSRSEIRLRAMGDKALLPKGFWDGEGLGRSLVRRGKGKEKERYLPYPTAARSTGMGFAALGKPMPSSGLVNGHGGEADTREDGGKAGTSVNDAIEL